MNNLPAVPNGNDFDTLQRVSMALYESKYFNDVKSEAQAIVKVMAGAELGLPPFASMAGIHIIKGKPVLGANVIATLVKNDARYNYQLEQSPNEDEDTICIISWYENGKHTGISTFTIEEAQVAGLAGKDNWTKYPSDMLFARAISRGARRFAPGIFGGAPVYTPDEMSLEVDPDGFVNIVEGEVAPTREMGSDNTGINPVGPEPVAEQPPDPVKAEPSDNGQLPDINKDPRAWLEAQCEKDQTLLGRVWKAVSATGKYTGWQHAKNAMTPNEKTGNEGFVCPKGFKIEAEQKITCAGAMNVYDWLMERKEDEPKEATKADTPV